MVIGSGAETVTSGDATLAVTAPVGGNRYYLLAAAGPSALGSITFANGPQDTSTQAVFGIDTAAPGSIPVTVEPVGPTSFQFGSFIEGTFAAGRVSGLRSRIATYFKDGRLYQVDQLVGTGALPVPRRVSTLITSQVCGDSGIPSRPIYADGNDFANPNGSWLFLRGPGADGLCSTGDDNHWAVQLGMLDVVAPHSLPGEPQVAVLGANGSFQRVVIRVGGQIRLTDDLVHDAGELLFTVDAASYVNLGRAFGSSLPGIWLFFEGGKVWGVDLAAPATRVVLATLAAGESVSPTIVSDGANAFIALVTATGTRVLRVSESLANTSPVVTLNQPLNSMAVSLSRLVLLTQGTAAQLLSVGKNGGVATLLATLGAGVLPGVLLAAGENVYLAQYELGATGSSVSTLVIGADGSNPVTLPNTDIKRSIAPSVSLANAPSATYAVVLADGVTSLLSNAGSTLRVINGATRGTLLTYGSLPATPDGFLSLATFDPLQFGQSGLFTFIDSSSGLVGLYYFRSDAAGLIHVPN